MSTPLDHARDLLNRGLSPIPVPHKQKAPVLTGWTNLRLTAGDLPRHFNGTPCNIGTLLGAAAGWIVDVDLDHPRAVALAEKHLPPTGMIWGRDGKPRSHWIYKVAAPVKTTKWRGKMEGMLVELRSSGCQTIAPGSVHPSGEAIRWDTSGSPTIIDPEVLLKSINSLAAAVRIDIGEPTDVASTRPHVPQSTESDKPQVQGTTAYGRKALEREAEALATTAAGSRNDVLNRAGFSIGTLIGGGEVDRSEAEAVLLAAALQCGLPETEARKTLASGLNDGTKEPRHPSSRQGQPPRRPGNDGEDASDETENFADAERIVRLVLEEFRLGQTPKREPFLVRRNGPNVAEMISGSGGRVRGAISKAFRGRYGRVMGSTAFSDALATLCGMAADAPFEPLHIRVGAHADGIVLDLGTNDGAAVVVNPQGWRVEARSPILFQRTALVGELPQPVAGGDLEALRALLNVTPDSWPVLKGWLVTALLPDLPHPILMLGGGQGCGKTTAAKFITGLFDPSDAQIRSQPRDAEAWAIGAANCWATVIDNISTIPDWFSDALCKAVTGDGFVRRTLYTNGDVTILSFKRVIVLTSIDAGALRGDLGERLVLIDLEPIPAHRRRTEAELVAGFQSLRSVILGALLDLVAKVLGLLETIKLQTMPRMADFAKVLAAVDQATGTDSLRLYSEQAKRIAGEVIEGDPVGDALVTFVRSRGHWTGTAGALLEATSPDPADRRRLGWPETPRKLSSRIKRLAPAMAIQGVIITPPKPNDKARIYVLQATAQTALPPEDAARTPESQTVARAVGADQTDDHPNRPDGTPRREAQINESGRSGGSGGMSPDITNRADNWGVL